MITLQGYLYEVIRKELQKVKDANKAPFFASGNDVMSRIKKDVDETIDELVEDGLIVKSQNINGIPLYSITERK